MRDAALKLAWWAALFIVPLWAGLLLWFDPWGFTKTLVVATVTIATWELLNGRWKRT